MWCRRARSRLHLQAQNQLSPQVSIHSTMDFNLSVYLVFPYGANIAPFTLPAECERSVDDQQKAFSLFRGGNIFW